MTTPEDRPGSAQGIGLDPGPDYVAPTMALDAPPETTDVEALLAKVVLEHYYFAFDPSRCQGCGEHLPCVGEASDEHAAHVAAKQAAALVPWVAQQRADALREAADEWDAAGTVPRSILGNWLRERADRIAPTTEGDSGVTPQRHHYLSTACHHGKHDACRQVCKFCESACECSCHTPTTEAGQR